MNDGRFERTLAGLAGARKDTTRLERGFETRVMARVRENRDAPPAFFFMAWRLAPAFITVFIVASAWLYAAGSEQDVDHLAAMNARHEGIQLVNYLSGD